MAEKMKPDKLMLDVRQADAAGLSYGRWRFEETERIRKGKLRRMYISSKTVCRTSMRPFQIVMLTVAKWRQEVTLCRTERKRSLVVMVRCSFSWW